MHFDDSFPKRVATARAAIGLTQDELAQKVGIVRRQVAAYEGGEAKPRAKALINLAAALGTTSEWLASGKGSGPDIGEVKKTVTVREIPVLSHVRAGARNLEEALDFSSVTDFIPAPTGAGEMAFAIQIQGDSMESSEGVSFPRGSIVTFDPDIEARDGDFVLCTIDDFDTTFKQLILDQGTARLKPLNPSYCIMMGSGHPLTIIAVAIHVQKFIFKNNEVSHKPKWNPVAPWHDNDLPSYNFDAEVEKRIESMEKKIDLIVSLLSEDKSTN